ncbi:ABC transporter ATP-binding protein [Euzebya tangerina]|uniref:ABC transporter ATP-binding protein n=1 Tax=Euzebya tangerina TaxID=591198 RepID=UPI000E3160C9|nr:ABC transporter ATP-binding protein [Euzebya tangerina]
MTAYAIETTGLTKDYGDVRALVDLTLTVDRGEVFGFLGPNGAGKTTMIRTILDLIRPTAGRAQILGLDSHADAVEIRRHIGYLPGDLALYPNLTGRDTLTFFANLRGGVDWAVVDQLADRLGADLSKKVGEYSTGNRQKIGLIQAFMNEPQVIIMDEPSTGLDPLVQQEFQALMREVADVGRTVFLSSHTLSEVQRAADRVGIIRQGHLVDVESVHALRSKAIRRVEMTFEDPVDTAPFSALAGAEDVEVDHHTIRLSWGGHMSELLAVAGAHQLVDINSQEADLEEIFLAYYREEA